MPKKVNKINLQKLSKIFLVAGDFTRLQILCDIFCNKKICVSDLADNLKLSVAVVSHHLQIMSKLGIIDSVRDGKKICYFPSKNNPIAGDLKKLICKYH